MKNILYIFTSLLTLSAAAQVQINGATVHNNGAVLQVNANTVNNGGTFNNLGNTYFNGNYSHSNMLSTLTTNQALTDTIFCTGNWDVTFGDYDGANNFGNGYQGAVVFHGTNQNISEATGNDARNIYNVVFAGGGVKNINGTLVVANSIRLGNGIIRTTSTDTFALLSDGAILGSPGVASHINGPFFREGNTAVSDLFYPVGDGVRYRPFWFKNMPVGVPLPVFSVEAVNGATGGVAGVGVDNLIDTRHWYVNLLEGDYQGSQVEVSYGPAENVTDQSMLVVAQSDAVNGTYKSLDQSSTTGNLTAGSVISEFHGQEAYLMIGQSANMRVNVNAFLEGPYAGAYLMNSELYAGAYGNLLTTHYASGNADSNSYGIDMLRNYQVPNNPGADPTDVIMLTLRDGNNPTVDLDTAYAWLMQDGKILDFASGTKPYVTFSNTSLSPGANYTVVVHHRNHLPLMFSTGAAPFGLNVDQSTVAPAFFDVSDVANIYGIGYIDLGGPAGLYAGNGEQSITPLEINAFDLWVVGNDAQNNMPNNNLIITDVDLSGATNQTDWDITKWANDQLYYSTLP